MRRAALVTGASGGAGQEAARRMAEAGWDVAVHYYRNRAGAEITARAVTETGQQAAILQADLADPGAPERLMTAYDHAFPCLHSLINYARIPESCLAACDLAAERHVRIFAVNLNAPFLLSGLAVRRMSRRFGGEGGVIVNVVPGNALPGTPANGLDALTRELAAEAEDVRILSLRPARPGDVADTILGLVAPESGHRTGAQRCGPLH
ncbi:Enoyl-[acyl-carrier-protein] reductase [NADPH] FabL [Defluviimonas aquaemixtae]|uniref:Enoyl-[acyl-carrier-protein] reductase [NADPH] FabL n=1 Tax=Albidovulum aquaemixtae TaxID=1542388 RepID=A0A2R8B7R4_9RHOB|nr:SDR family NAD(P)-dependent oxidoreductase [Defluviimonas aquaemixtae]SPH18592.1 Enoyl-[acyl-carrier-protein] reductase [NADPH] FabL [Defluviimonas aquaemixtae]